MRAKLAHPRQNDLKVISNDLSMRPHCTKRCLRKVAHCPSWVKGSRDALKDGCPDYPPIADIGELSVRGSRKPACAKSILAPPDPSGGRMVLDFQEGPLVEPLLSRLFDHSCPPPVRPDASRFLLTRNAARVAVAASRIRAA